MYLLLHLQYPLTFFSSFLRLCISFKIYVPHTPSPLFISSFQVFFLLFSFVSTFRGHVSSNQPCKILSALYHPFSPVSPNQPCNIPAALYNPFSPGPSFQPCTSFQPRAILSAVYHHSSRVPSFQPCTILSALYHPFSPVPSFQPEPSVHPCTILSVLYHHFSSVSAFQLCILLILSLLYPSLSPTLTCVSSSFSPSSPELYNGSRSSRRSHRRVGGIVSPPELRHVPGSPK